MEFKKAKNRFLLDKKKYVKPTKASKIKLKYKVHTKIYISEDYELQEYEIVETKDNAYVIVNQGNGMMKVVKEQMMQQFYNLSRKMLEATIRQQLNDKLYKLSKGEADEWALQYYKAVKNKPEKLEKPEEEQDFNRVAFDKKSQRDKATLNYNNCSSCGTMLGSDRVCPICQF